MAAPLILVEAQPRRIADGVAETVRLAGGGGARPYHYADVHWRAGIEALPTITASLDYDGEIIGGGVPQAMTLSFAPNGQAAIDLLAAYYWRDAAITVRIGPEGALPPVIAQGTVLDTAISEGKLAIALADPAADLKKVLLTERYAGTGGLEGPAEWEGLLKRRVWGRVFNLSAEPIDAANNVYCLADPLRPIDAIVSVRDRGAPAAAMTFLAWQGTAAATLAALQTSVVPEGGCVVSPSIACLKWWTEPSGDLHADVRGEIGSAYVETTAQIAQRLVEALGGPAFVAGTVDAAALLRPAPIGWVAKDETTTVAAMLDELMANSSLMWLLAPSGEIVIRPWAWGASVASVQSEDVSRIKQLPPVTTRRLGYRRNESRMARGDLVAIVLATEVAYLDGTPAEELKPAEGGSDVTTGVIGVAEIKIAAEFGGAVTESLPRLQAFRLIRNAVDVTDDSSWSVTVQSGTIAASIGTDGVLSLDASAGVLTNSVLMIEASYNSRTYQAAVRVSKILSLPPSGGTSGASGGFAGGINSAVMSPISREITIEVGEDGAAALSANYTFTVDGSFDTFHVAAQWYRWNGTAYVALGSEQGSTDPAIGGRPSIGEPGEPGTGTCGFSDSGLTPSTFQKYRLYMRAISGSVLRTVSGSYSVVGS
ncbi:hypothetical protein OVY48_09855 [Sphingobium sp. SA2]|uniref:hypothetical protein n=1 Tax=Sphingobium sp. SA2 TaxID=1524832 RepID=UPI0028C070D4|nr:hypothetical protein [Sphingobium sp. SA2]MDT7533727.1 hypothetical protein [Sphingobium sp. SA2]